MPPKIKSNSSKKEIALKKSIAAKARLAKIKSDPVLLAEYKEKERLKYLKKKEKGQRKCIKDMTPREQRKIRKKWKKYSSDYRHNQQFKQARINHLTENTRSSSGDEVPEQNEPPEPVNIENRNLQNVRRDEAKKRSFRQRKLRNVLLKDKTAKIEELKKKLNTKQKKYNRLKKRLEKTDNGLTPRTKIKNMAEDPNQSKELVKKALFGEVLRTQITENYAKATTHKERSNFKKLLSGPTSDKYKLWRLDNYSMTYKKLNRRRSKDSEEKIKARKKRVVTLIQKFYEDDSNSRNAAGKKECITRNSVKKQKRYLLDSLKNLHKKFLKTNTLTVAYSLFCRLRPFWVVPPKLTNRDTCACIVHENINLKLSALKRTKVLGFDNHQSALQILCCDRYSEKCLIRECNDCSSETLPYAQFDNSEDILVAQWHYGKEMFKDPKTKKERFVSKYKKEKMSVKPRDLIIQLEADLLKLFNHEMNIVHQHRTLKSLKQSLTEKDTIIHMDFSENYTTKCNQEIQSFHFGGSRTQISLHTVVVYTKGSTTSYCTVSLNLAHNVAGIWAHLQPVLQSLPPGVENLHFLSDGPVTQYRNKTMFFILACKLQEFYPGVMTFSWNYHEAGHGKGAPDGVGATCKRTADKVIAQKTDITNLNEFVNTLRENCPGIKISVIEDKEIETVNNLIKENESNLQSFKGTLMVHQVTGGVYSPNKVIMKSLSCFCNKDCEHYKLGSLEYNVKPDRLKVSDVFTDSEEEIIPIQSSSKIETEVQADLSQNRSDKSKVTYGSGDYVLVKLLSKNKEYRYAAICSSYDEDEGELTVTFLKIYNEEENLFKLDETDVADVPYEDLIKKLPIPNLIVKGDRVFYKFKKAIDVFEK